MNGSFSRTGILVPGWALLSVALACAAGPPRYIPLPVGALLGNGSIPRCINSSTQVTGSSGLPHGPGARAFVWGRGFNIRGINPLPGGDESEGYGINDAGAIVGIANLANGNHAFLWTGANGLRNLGTLPGDTSSKAFAINKAGQIVGSSSGPRGIRAVRWSPSGVIQSLGTLLDDTVSEALATNSIGDVVGYSRGPSGMRGFIWTEASGMQPLAGLPPTRSSRATAINNARQVVGMSGDGQNTRAFLWENGIVTDLETLRGGRYTIAASINNVGQVIGSSLDEASGETRAFIWTKATGMEDLSDVVDQTGSLLLVSAFSINDNGEIVVLGAINMNSGRDMFPARLDHRMHISAQLAFVLIPISLPKNAPIL